MRPGQQSPRKPDSGGGGPDGHGRFNEAGATIAPETTGTVAGHGRSRHGFNEAGATIAPETPHLLRAPEGDAQPLQ